jgi:hypothetical protein
MLLCTYLLIRIRLYLLVGRSPSPAPKKQIRVLPGMPFPHAGNSPGCDQQCCAQGRVSSAAKLRVLGLEEPATNFPSVARPRNTSQALLNLHKAALQRPSAAVSVAVVGASRPTGAGKMPSRQPARCRRYESYKYGSNERAAGTDQAPWSCPHACAIRLARRWRHFDKSCWDQKDRPTPRRK